MSINRKRIKMIGLWVLGLYLAGGAALYLLQDKLLFHPEILPGNYKYKFDLPFEELQIPVNKKVNLSAVLFKAPQPRGIVLYFHGNSQNISRYAKVMNNFTKNGYEVLIMDYRGFGKSTGRLSEAALYEDALIMYNVARARFEPQQIVIYGKSIGTCVATQLASVRDCKRLLLETPYYSITEVAFSKAPVYPVSWLLKYELPTHTYLPKVAAPVTIFHGTSDGTVPYSSGKKLEAFFKKGDEFITLKGGAHNNLNDYPLFHQKLDSLLQH